MAEPPQRDEVANDVVADITAWLVSQGLEGASREHVLQGYCERLVAVGTRLQRVHVAQRALHPVFGGLGFDWYRDSGVVREDYVRHAVAPEKWAESPFYYMLREGVRELRQCLAGATGPYDFPIFDELRGEGATDYFAAMLSFAKPTEGGGYDPNDPPEGCIMSWTCDAPAGFTDDDIDTLRTLLPTLGLVLKSASNRAIMQDLLAIYLGPDAGARVLSGAIQRGSLETIHAAILYFDLQGFTSLAQTLSGSSTIAMLNDYFGSVVAIVEEHGGNVLKFMGDGLLAIFSAADQEDASRSAVVVAVAIRDRMAGINGRRRNQELPFTGFSLALHAGEVMYGNIGGETRLDFTVIGPAVNAASRMLDMCRSLDRDLVMSADVARPVMAQRDDVVALGRHMLRGFPEPHELFTLHAPPHG